MKDLDEDDLPVLESHRMIMRAMERFKSMSRKERILVMVKSGIITPLQGQRAIEKLEEKQ